MHSLPALHSVYMTGPDEKDQPVQASPVPVPAIILRVAAAVSRAVLLTAFRSGHQTGCGKTIRLLTVLSCHR